MASCPDALLYRTYLLARATVPYCMSRLYMYRYSNVIYAVQQNSMKMIFSPVQSVSCVLDCTGAPVSATQKSYVSYATYVLHTYLRLTSKD